MKNYRSKFIFTGLVLALALSPVVKAQECADEQVVLRKKTIAIDKAGDGSINTLTVETYDQAGKIQTKTVDHDADGIQEEITTYQYENGLLAKTVTVYSEAGKPDFVSNYSYDSEGRLLEELSEYDGDGIPDRIITHDYYPDGLLKSKGFDYNVDGIPDGIQEYIEYHTDFHDNEHPLTIVIHRDNDLDGTMDQQDQLDYLYDDQGRKIFESIDYNIDGTIEFSSDYIYGSDGLLTILVDENGDGQTDDIRVRSFDSQQNLLTESLDSNADGTINTLTTYHNEYCSLSNQILPELCGNGSDDDGDGIVDCEDPDCSEDVFCEGEGGGCALISSPRLGGPAFGVWMLAALALGLTLQRRFSRRLPK
ncbi:MAG: hypothetical protein IT573_01195 [Deltaproteobacteria bacterium]|nr:hypothetical protein [Deltaproteobacteria bacterium]